MDRAIDRAVAVELSRVDVVDARDCAAQQGDGLGGLDRAKLQRAIADACHLVVTKAVDVARRRDQSRMVGHAGPPC